MKKTLLFLVCLLAIILLPFKQGECYVTLKYKEVPFSGIGNLSLPKDIIIKEFDIKSYSKVITGEANYFDDDFAEVVHFYQVVIHDGQNNRVAYVITFIENKISKNKI